ncbi:MAG: glycosyltransferase family 4 protein [Chlorobium sp.]|nr:glycosyltransferase family 4 protein [Chlorobium sp.]
MTKVVLLASKNLSGINIPIVQELNKEWNIASNIDPFYIPLHLKLKHAIQSFSPERSEWKIRYHELRSLHQRRPKAFTLRTNSCKNQLKKLNEDYDLIFQLMSTFAPCESKLTKPYIIYLDRTQKMAEKYFPALFEKMSKQEKRELHYLVRRTFEIADKIYTFSDATKMSVINDYEIPREKVVQVGFGVNLNPPPVINKTSNMKVVSVISDFKRHGGQVCIDTMEMVLKKNPSVKFLFIGQVKEGFQKKFKRNVTILPYISYQELLEHYEESSVFFAPAAIGSAQSITEAMAYRCVCVANAENPDASNVISDQDNGFLIEGNSPTDYATKILDILEQKYNNGLIGSNAYRNIKENYTWERVIGKIIAGTLPLL